MYIFVVVQEKESYYNDGPHGGPVKARLELASGERCLIVPYREFNLRAVRELNPRAIVMSGFGGHFQSRKIEWFFGMDEVLRRADLPMLCICGSHQLAGFSFNGKIRALRRLRDEPIRKLAPAEDRPRRAAGDPRYDLSGYFVAEGFFPVARTKADPLFRGMPRRMVMRCSHYCEVKNLPPGFEIIAASRHCRIEAMRHRERPLYGTQFHPEAYAPPFLDGKTLLSNFAEIVRDFWRRRRA